MGYLRADVPVGHPDFGRLEICVCRRANLTDTVRERLFALSHLDELKDAFPNRIEVEKTDRGSTVRVI